MDESGARVAAQDGGGGGAQARPQRASLPASEGPRPSAGPSQPLIRFLILSLKDSEARVAARRAMRLGPGSGGASGQRVDLAALHRHRQFQILAVDEIAMLHQQRAGGGVDVRVLAVEA